MMASEETLPEIDRPGSLPPASPTERNPTRTAAATQFVRNSGYGMVAGLGTAGGNFLTTVILAHVLGVARTGMVSFAMWTVMLCAAVTDLGTQASLARYLPELTAASRGDEIGGLIKFLMVRRLAPAVALAAVGFFFIAARVPQSGIYGAPAIWLLVGLAATLQAVSAFTFNYLRGMQRFDRLAALTIISGGLQLVGVAAGSRWFGIEGAIAGYCVGAIGPAGIALFLVRADARLAAELRRRVSRYALYAWAAGLASTVVWSRFEVFFLERSWGNEAVGLFAVGLTLSNLATHGQMLLRAGLLPYFASSFGRNAVSEIKGAYCTVIRIMAFVMLPASFGLAAVMPAVLPLIYGRAFAQAVPAATLLVVAAAFSAATAAGADVCSGMERSDFIFFSGLACAGISILGGLTVIPFFGVMGAAITRAAMQACAIGLGNWFIMRRLDFPLPLKDLGRLVVAAALCAGAARAVLAGWPGRGALPAAVVAGALVYIGAVRLSGGLPQQDIARLRALGRALPTIFQGPLAIALRVIAPPCETLNMGPGDAR